MDVCTADDFLHSFETLPGCHRLRRTLHVEDVAAARQKRADLLPLNPANCPLIDGDDADRYLRIGGRKLIDVRSLAIQENPTDAVRHGVARDARQSVCGDGL